MGGVIIAKASDNKLSLNLFQVMVIGALVLLYKVSNKGKMLCGLLRLMTSTVSFQRVIWAKVLAVKLINNPSKINFFMLLKV